jgi:hypothetical protein
VLISEMLQTCTTAPSMRRPVAVKRFFSLPKLRDLLGPTNGRPAGCPFARGPFPSSQVSLRNGRKLSRARSLCAACAPLTDSFRSGTWNQRERGRGSQGARPMAEYEAAPHARCQARRPPAIDFQVICLSGSVPFLRGLFFCQLTPAPLSPCFHPHSIAAAAAVPIGVLNSGSAAISVAI